VIRSAGVEPGVVPVEGDAVAALHDRVLEQFGGQAGIVVVQAIQQLGTHRADVRPLEDRELDGVPARNAQREEPRVDQLVVGVDPELAGRPEGLRRARVATAADERQAGGQDEPRGEHRSTPVPVRIPQQKAA